MQMRRYEPTEITLGPLTAVAFRSDPVALPKRTCLVAYGPGLDLVVRVDEVDAEGVAHGTKLALRKRGGGKKQRGVVKAADLIDAGSRAMAGG